MRGQELCGALRLHDQLRLATLRVLSGGQQ